MYFDLDLQNRFVTSYYLFYLVQELLSTEDKIGETWFLQFSYDIPQIIMDSLCSIDLKQNKFSVLKTTLEISS